MRTHRSLPSVARLTAALLAATAAVGCASSSPPLANCPSPKLPDASLQGDLSASGSASASADASADVDAAARAHTDAELREAAELRARARANIDAGKLREALPDLERAFELSGDVTLLGDLGLALQAAGRLEEAWLALNRFRLEARAQYEPVRVKIDAALGDLEKQLGGLIIEANAPDAVVLVRGKLAARLPMAAPIFLAPGDVSLVVRARGKADATVRARVAIGQVARARADLGLDGVGVGVGGVGVGVGTGGVGVGLGGVGKLGVGRPGVGGLGLGAPNVGAPNVGAPNVGAPNIGTPGVGGIGAGGLSAPAVPIAPPSPPIWPIVVGVGGLVVVGGAITASVVHSNQLDAFDLNVCEGSNPGPECPSINSGLKVTTGLQVAGYLLGGVALTTGIVVFAITRSAPSPSIDCPDVAAQKRPIIACGPRTGGGATGFGCAGTF